MNKISQILNTILNKLNFISSDNKISITNLTVAVFVLITAFRSLFGGSTLQVHGFNWVIQTIDYSDTLPLLFGLLNYSHKRQMINNQPAPSMDASKGQ
jgi:hypothetical protein